MGYVAIGSVSVPYEWLAFFIAVVFQGWRTGHIEKESKDVADTLLWIYLIVWKVSYIVFDWAALCSSPVSIIYFDGGWKGHVHAFVIDLRVLVSFKKKLSFYC